MGNKIKKLVFMLVYFGLSLSITLFLGNIPYFGFAFTIIIYAIYFSIFLFLLKWSYNIFILYFFEKHLMYFIGFGLTFSFLTSLITGLLNDGVYWLLFPIFLLNAM